MMDTNGMMTISEVTKEYDVSTRMLRYYDEIGLLKSERMENYAYRVYDAAAVRRLQQILTLRKLRIPLKKIAEIFESAEQAKIVEVFEESISELDGEIEAMQTIRGILEAFVARLNKAANLNVELGLLRDAEMMNVINTLCPSKNSLKEKYTMNDLSKANETISKLKNVRIVYLPPFTVAASRYFGENPEDNAGAAMDEFVKSSGLVKVKPDLRLIGFNSPSPTKAGEIYGYEFCVTIPDDFEVSAPLEKKKFAGGLYAAHCIKMGDFHEWKLLADWVRDNSEYEYDMREPLGMEGSLEEHLNAYSYFTHTNNADSFTQLDLLIPVKAK